MALSLVCWQYCDDSFIVNKKKIIIKIIIIIIIMASMHIYLD